MSNDLNPNVTRTPLPEPTVDAAHSAERATENAQAQASKIGQIKTPELQAEPETPSNLSFEFLNVFQSVFQEGYESYKPPPPDSGGGAPNDFKGNDFQKELQTVREFMKEAGHLIKDQNLDVRQMVNRLKTEQGGVFWQRAQQILQKGLPVSQTVNFQKMEKNVEMRARVYGPGGETPESGEGKTERLLHRPGTALLDLLKAESNPLTPAEAYASILQQLKKDGLQNSSEKLTSYLQHKWGMNEEQMQHFLRDQGIVYWQNAMPRKEKEFSNIWYLLIALLIIPVATVLGANLLTACLLGLGGATGFLFLQSRMKKK